MPRRLRCDYPGAWHHVVDRGVARRTLFETGKDVRFLLSALARQVRSGDIEVHAYSILTTHFHLLVRSPRGQLSRAMQRLLDAYARWFNRARRRDGPLFRGRFSNRTIEDEGYFVNVVRYIDRNPVDAGLVRRPEDHPFGSARYYMGATPPPWLETGEVRRLVGAPRPGGDFAVEYRRRFAEGFDSARLSWRIERGLSECRRHAEQRQGLLASAPAPVLERLRRRGLLADGVAGPSTIRDPDTVSEAIASVLREASHEASEKRREPPVRDTTACAALRALSGLRMEEIAVRLSLTPSGVRRRLSLHDRRLREEGDYARDFGKVLEKVLIGPDPPPTS